MRNCPDVPILNFLFGLCLIVVFVVVLFVVIVLIVVVLVVVFFVVIVFVVVVFVVVVVVFVVIIVVFVVVVVSSLKSHSLCQNSKVALTDSLTQSVTKVRYRAARAAKKTGKEVFNVQGNLIQSN